MRHLSDLARALGCCLPLIAVGCGSQAAPLHPLHGPSAPPPALAAEFTAETTGTIRGRVVWSGALPDSHTFRDAALASGEEVDRLDRSNPGLPRINASGNGVAGAVVFLRQVEPRLSKPWDLAPVRVVMHDELIQVEQRGAEQATGFVHVGDSVEMISTNPQLEMLRAQGASFFTLPFPDPNFALQRAFPNTGLVELSSGVGHIMARSWLMVAEHPYYVRTDADGNFSLAHVPEGAYELVCWMPNWNMERFERDPEVLNVSRVWFKPPMQRSIAVKVSRGAIVEVEFKPGVGNFSTSR